MSSAPEAATSSSVPTRPGRWWVGIDIGGTFTDFVIYESLAGRLYVHKALTPRSRRAESILDGLDVALQRYGVDAAEVAFIGHGTTVATNAVLTREVPPTGLITTDGFGDILVIRRQTRPDTFDYYADYPAPLVPRDAVFEVLERVDARGGVVVPLTDHEGRQVLERMAGAGLTSVAVSLLHSYANPAHERALARLAAEFPQLQVCLSSELVPEFREYERTSTTVVNAFVRPVVIAYLTAFEEGLRERGINSPLIVMQGNGGVMSVDTASRQPVGLIRSGPAAGVAGAAFFASLAGADRIMTLDMGGTSTDVAVFDGDQPPTLRDWDVLTYPVRWTTLDIRSIGAGGGSIAWVDGGGLLKVGPASAGAEPGPACYGRGGRRATLTDAAVVLGRIGPGVRLGGSIGIKAGLAQSALEEVGQALGLPAQQAAAGVIEIVNAAIAQEIHFVCAERGVAARDYTLVCFGGAGGLHASEVAQELGITRILVPPSPGLLCAFGMLTSAPRADFGITRMVPLSGAEPAASLEELRAELEAGAARWLQEQRIPHRRITFEWSLDLRYRGQNYELPVAMDRRSTCIAGLVESFHEQHERAYGYRYEDAGVECVAMRLRCVIEVDHPPVELQARPAGVATAPSHRSVHMGRRWGNVRAAVHQRDQMAAGSSFVGPAIVEQLDATTMILPHQHASVDEHGNIHLTWGSES
jgi:N-methylhydantoinase A